MSDEEVIVEFSDSDDVSSIELELEDEPISTNEKTETNDREKIHLKSGAVLTENSNSLHDTSIQITTDDTNIEIDNKENLNGISRNILIPKDTTLTLKKSKELNTTNSTVLNCLDKAKKFLHPSNIPEDVIGREDEVNFLNEFLDVNLSNNLSGSLYVSGPPGTGKTLTINNLLRDLQSKSIYSFISVKINCVGVNSSKSLYQLFIDSLPSGHQITGNTKYLSQSIEKLLISNAKMIVLVADEVDQLPKSLLFQIFKWSSLPKSKLLTIAIANSLDLTEKIAYDLDSLEKPPKTLHFRAYTHIQISQIIEDRLCEIDHPIFEKSAIQFISKKISESYGDIRKALNISVNAIDRLIDRLKTQPNLEKNQLTVKLQDVAIILKKSSSNMCDVVSELPFHQKLLLCSLILLRRKKDAAYSVSQIYGKYKMICSQQGLESVSSSEFFELLDGLQSSNLVQSEKNKTTKSKSREMNQLYKITSNDNDVIFSLNQIRICKEIIEN